MDTITEHQKMSIGTADETLAAAKLPTYSELVNALNTLALYVLAHDALEQGDSVRTLAYESQALVCRAL